MIAPSSLTRRAALASAALGLFPRAAWAADATAQFKAIETRLRGRLGVAALDTGTGARLGYRADERFAMCSTFKLLLAAAILARVDAGKLSLQQRVPFTKADLLGVAPVSRAHVGEGGLSLERLCAAAVSESDNTAANLLLGLVGGPEGYTRYLRGLGDPITRLDRRELALNTNLPGDPRDTATPNATEGNLRRVLAGDALSPASRERLTGWMIATQTGLARLRAGLPRTWRVGDKTGTGGNGALNDIAVAWPPGRPPIVIAAYSSGSSAPAADREAGLAEVGRIVAKAFA